LTTDGNQLERNLNDTERKTGITVRELNEKKLAYLSRADSYKICDSDPTRFMLNSCIACFRATTSKAISGIKHVPAVAAFAGIIIRKIHNVAANAVSFVRMSIALTGMAFFSQAITLLQTIVVALGAGLGVWGVINLLEGYGNDNPGAKSQGIKQLMAGVGVALVGTQLVPLLSGLFA